MTWREYTEPIREVAESLKLRPKSVYYEEVDRDTLYELAAYGLPTMYHHWRYGRDYWRQKHGHDTGRHLIYEMVVNLDPAIAYLLRDNRLEEQIAVIAHVQGHLDLFARNVWCAEQRGDMNAVLQAANLRWSKYEDRYGSYSVETVLDVAHMLIPNVTPYAGQRRVYPITPHRGKYDDLLRSTEELPPPSTVEIAELAVREAARVGRDETDILYFLIHHLNPPLPEWQRDILTGVREVALYFLPQARTKIIHEGHASRYTSRILDELGQVPESIYFHASRMEALVSGVAIYPGGELNPYWLGRRLLDYLEERGENILDIVAYEDDQSLIRNWLDGEFVQRTPELRELIDRAFFEESPDGWKRESLRPAWEQREPWQWWRDRYAALLGSRVTPPLEVAVIENTSTLIELKARQTPDMNYTSPVCKGIATLTRRNVRIYTPEGASYLFSPNSA